MPENLYKRTVIGGELDKRSPRPFATPENPPELNVCIEDPPRSSHDCIDKPPESTEKLYKRIGYRLQRGIKTAQAVVFAYRLGPRNGVKEYLGGFADLDELREYHPNAELVEMK